MERTRRPRPALALLYVLFLLALVELGAYVALSLLSRSPVSARRIREQMIAAVGEDGENSPAAHAVLDLHTGIHPYLGFMHRSYPKGDPQSRVFLNQPALYEPSSPIFAKAADRAVVAISGGSVAYRFALEGLEALTNELSDQPMFSGKKIQYVVLAFSGAKQPQQLMALNYLLALGGSVDVLINLDGYNEIALHEQENHTQGVAPIYPRAWFYRVQRNEILPSLGELLHLEHSRRELARTAQDSLFRHSWTYRLSWRIRDDRLAHSVSRLEEYLRDYQARQKSDLVLSGPPSRARSQDERLDELTAIWKNSSEQLDRVCRGNGIKYFHFLQPNQYVADSKPLSEEELRDAFNPGWSYSAVVPVGYAKLLEGGAELARSGVCFFDLTRVFADEVRTLYVDECCHFNELGNVLLAQEMARLIGESVD